jgi:membrane protein DedA with SNARE-associated domain
MTSSAATIWGAQLVGKLYEWDKHLAGHAWGWVVNHGPEALFFLLFASGLGLPLPEDVPLIAAGFCIAQKKMLWIVGAPVAWFAMMCGDSSLYVLGYLLGWRVVHLPLLGRHLSQDRLKKCEGWFDRWGMWTVGIGRMFAGIRTAIVVTAGSLRFNYGKLLLADGLAAMVSGGAFMLLGYWAGLQATKFKNARPVIEPMVERYRTVFTLTALGAAFALIGILWWRARKRVRLAGMAKGGTELAAPGNSAVVATSEKLP